MLTATEIRDVLAEVTFYPGWRFTVVEGHPEGLQLNVRAEVLDAYHPDSTVTLSIDTFIPPHRKPSEFLTWLGWRLGRIAVHEAAEWLRYRGMLLRDPHSTWGC